MHIGSKRMRMRDGFNEIKSMMERLNRDHCALDKSITPDGVTYQGYISGTGDTHIIQSGKSILTRFRFCRGLWALEISRDGEIEATFPMVQIIPVLQL